MAEFEEEVEDAEAEEAAHASLNRKFVSITNEHQDAEDPQRLHLARLKWQQASSACRNMASIALQAEGYPNVSIAVAAFARVNSSDERRTIRPRPGSENPRPRGP